MATRTILAADRYRAGDTSVLFRHRLARSGTPKRGVVVLTGHTGDSTQAMLFPGLRRLCKRVAAAGVDVFAIDGGGPATWGNDTAIAAIDQAVAYMRGTLGVYGAVVAVGYSMGGADAMNWTARRPADAAGFLGIAPISDLDAAHAGQFAAVIDAAYPGGYPVGHDPTSDLAGQLAARPWRAYYATDDATIPRATVETLAGLVGGTLVPLVGGHVGLMDDAFPAAAAAAWVLRTLHATA